MTSMTKKILLVEKDEVLRSSISRKLFKEGYEVIEIADAKEGLRILYDIRPDAVILGLGTTEGIQILEEKNASSFLRVIPFVVLAQSGQERELEMAKELGAAAIVKLDTTNSQELLDKIKEIIGLPY